MRATKTFEPSDAVDAFLLGRPAELRLIISSTTLDLREHREQIRQACGCQGVIPIMMEDLPVNSEEAIATSLTMANQADIYLGIFASRYGYVPAADNPEQISITEMEYNRAVIRGIPRMIFMAAKSHSVMIADVEVEKAAKLAAFKKRLGIENAVTFFKSPADLGNRVFGALTRYRLGQRAGFE